MYHFRNDYSVGCHPEVLEALISANGECVTGYGFDPYCEEAAGLIRELCHAPKAEVQFLVGGTQTNFTAIAAFLRPWESVIAPAAGHINTHEVGAVEATGHKILPVYTRASGKLTSNDVLSIVEECEDEHLTKPRLVYISNSTETGGIYTKAELIDLAITCRRNGLFLFLDGARLGCALMAKGSDLTPADLAEWCDAFYIGGTKNGAMMGEALVICNPELQKDFFRIKKQMGAVLAKGWLLGIQFTALLKDGLYFKIAKQANEVAQYLQGGLKNLGIPMMVDSPTNQIFPIFPDELLPELEKVVTFETWGKADKTHTVIRFVTSFATTLADANGLLNEIKNLT